MSIRTLRRFLAIGTLALWLGGVVFYGAVVIPTAHDVIGSHREIGFVTRKVTGTLNVIGAVAIALLLWSTFGEAPGGSRAHRIGLWATWAVLLTGQVLLFIMRSRLEGMTDPVRMTVLDRSAFFWLHERYLNMTTIVCLAGLVHLGMLIAGFDRAARTTSA